ncbi:Aldolase-type TIM barrel [Penicillium malachiteum]|uniref:Aldolase-type TIM barrel n=1 Tax=Penicillium malachiteum TaxID=1324776 RepID=A0AAD6MZT3_9EURO|nr:Aldolase-type TIM barrel [Penicillium malachiteum]
MHAKTRNTTSTHPIIGPAHRVKKSQITFIRPAQMSLFARVTSYPPLGQVTCLKRKQENSQSKEYDPVRFTVVIESSTSLPQQSWEAQIWHNIGSEWKALLLEKIDSSHAPLLSGSETDYNFYRHVFSEEITLPLTGGYAQFTVRFRTNPETEWQWVNQQRPVNDGELVFGPRDSELDQTSVPLDARMGLSKYIDNLSSEVQIESRRSDCPGSSLWAISGNVDEATEGVSGVKRFTLGVPSSMVKYFSLVRIWTPWLGPRHGKDKFKLTEDAMLCSFLRSDGTHLLLLAISGINDVLTLFKSSDDGKVVINAKNDNKENAQFLVLASVAEDFEVGMSALIYESRKVVRPFANPANEPLEPPLSPPGDDTVLVEKDAKVQWMTEWFDGLTYCTWNGLGQNLTEEKIMGALDALKSHGINIVNLIIDDNWQSLDNEGESQFKRRWQRFEANTKAFPRGLKHTVTTIRQSHRSIQHIAVWHALLGYWGGICPDSEITEHYKTKEVKVKDPAAGGPIAHDIADGKILAIDPEDIQRFYDDFYKYLVSVGVDSVKADAQFFIDLLEDPEDRKCFMTSYQDAWSISSLRHFSTRAISCMSMIPQMIFHSQLPNTKPTIALRNSDDFFPEIPTSHPWHVFCNAHNALFTRYLNALPDWDMFQTSHPYASFHAAARCVSGGPVYITDEPGKHDLKLLNEMTAPTVYGTTVILRPSVTGRTLDIYHDYNEGHILRVGCYTGWAKTGSGIIGLFNISSVETSCMISLTDFPGIHEDSDGQYVVRAHKSGKVAGLMQPFSEDSLVSVVLQERGWDILTAYPTQSFALKGNQDSLTHVAILGLLGKMTGAAAVVSSEIFVVESGRLRFDVHLKALGTLGLYISDLQDRTITQNFIVMILGEAIPQETVWKEGGEDSQVLAIDVHAAWKAMKLDSGWSNEAFVQIFVG